MTTLPVLLIVSEDKEKVLILEQALKGQWHLVSRPEKTAAWEYFQNAVVDLIIIEEKEGDLTFIRALHKEKVTLPILLLSNKLKKSFLLEALQAGVTDFLREPLDPQEVDTRVTILLKSQETQKKTVFLLEHLKSSLSLQDAPSLLEHLFLDMRRRHQSNQPYKEDLPISLLLIEWEIETDTPLPIEPVVEEIHSLLNEQLRLQDILIRQKNARFLLILPYTSLEEASKRAQALRETLEKASFSLNPSLSLHIFIAVASFEEKEELSNPSLTALDHCEHLMHKVEEALRHARIGNRITLKTESVR